jgi:2-methylcitrate dehydratase PrpD
MTPLSLLLTRLIRARAVDAADLRNAERYVRDWLGSLVAGGATSAGAMLRAYARQRTDLEGRVFLAAALSHITETDDLHRASTTHPACVVVPVSLLLARVLGASGPDALRAVLCGYEAMLRVGEALGPGHYRIFHNTATAGVFGAAAAAASLLDLDESGWVWALGNAGTQASGLWQFSEDATMSKHLHAGHAAEAGLRAALLAREGFTGPAAILEGEKGFFRGFCPDPQPDRVLAPSNGWKLAETSLKPYPSCRHTHPAIDAALEIRENQGEYDVSRAAEIQIASYPVALRITDNSAPASSYAARFSIQFCVATALAHGSPGLHAFAEENLSSGDSVVHRLMDRTRVRVDPDLASAYPARWGAAVEVVWPDGRRQGARREVATGDPEDPLSEAELTAKVRDLFAYGGVLQEDAEELLGWCGGLVEG